MITCKIGRNIGGKFTEIPLMTEGTNSIYQKCAREEEKVYMAGIPPNLQDSQQYAKYEEACELMGCGLGQLDELVDTLKNLISG